MILLSGCSNAATIWLTRGRHMHTRLMTTWMMVGCLLLLGNQALAQPPLPTFQSGQVLTADQLNRIVEQVRRNTTAAGGSGGGATQSVDCDAGETVQGKIDEAEPGDTIMITGTCHEAVVVDKDDITLDGGGTAVIDGIDSDAAAIYVDGRQNVTIKGLTVQNGLYGIKLVESAAAWLVDVTARGSRLKSRHDSGDGIVAVNASSVVLAGTVVADDNARNGLGVYRTSSAIVIGNWSIEEESLGPASLQVSGNGDHGISVTEGSALTAGSAHGANTTIRTRNAKKYNGISIENGASLVMYGGSSLESTGNKGAGLAVGVGSSATFYGWADESRGASGLFDSNGGAGISIWGSSAFNVWDDGAAVNITSTNNSGRGLDIWGGSDAGFQSPASEPVSKLVFNGNGAEGIEVGGNATLYSRLPSEMKNNAYEGVGLWAGGHVGLEASTIADNTGHGIAAVTNTALWLATSRIENNGNDGIEVSNNSTAHLYDITVTGNGGHGISVYNHGHVQAFQDTGSSVTGNGGHGINAWNGASLQLDNAVITGNTNNAINASFGSRFYLSGGTVTGHVYCDPSVLSQGDVPCPE